MSNILETTVGQGINPALLDQQLRAALTTITGTTFAGTDAVAYFNYAPVSAADTATFNSVCAAHVPTQQTAAQVATAAANTTITALRAAIDKEAAYFAAVPAADLTDGVALARLCVDFARVLIALEARL